MRILTRRWSAWIIRLASLELIKLPDRSAAVLGVHLFGDHVVPLLVFRAGAHPGSDLDLCRGGLGALHFAGRLVSFIIDLKYI